MERNNKLAVKKLRDKQSELFKLEHSYNKILQENELLKNENLKLKQDNKSIQQECKNYLETINQYENKINGLDEKINTLQNMLLSLNQNKHVLLSDILSRENACLQEINKYKAIIKEKDHYIAMLQNLENEINILSSGSEVENEIYINRHKRIIILLTELTNIMLIKWEVLDPNERLYKNILMNTQRTDFDFDADLDIYMVTFKLYHFILHWNQDTNKLYGFYGLHKYRWTYSPLEVSNELLDDLLNSITNQSYKDDACWTLTGKSTKLIMNSYNDYKITEEW